MNFNTNNTLDTAGTKGARSKPATPSAPETKIPAADVNPVSKGASDQVVLSQEAQTLGRLQAKINSSPDIDLDKVAEIRRAIAEGRFEINPDRIAENMLNQNDLLG
ncbi:flagellar biosynthesis anti-sigma factor FlgM [Cellvibrio sp. OA-2007]|uniref:flagellar biosynthesis anti-sigma factor FlgM n=1 Tax=Cellvibrio sp. OA-2007 TaxID=529823 RepID=UPI00078464BF|nr:flagellar biosynthesis anti-sigma factor FlgM [Cellvibrio sp. OA-2007]